MVRVSKAVVISGAHEEDDGMTSIEGGRVPFYVDVQGAPVTIQRLRFIRPTRNAIRVYAVSGLVARTIDFGTSANPPANVRVAPFNGLRILIAFTNVSHQLSA